MSRLSLAPTPRFWIFILLAGLALTGMTVRYDYVIIDYVHAPLLYQALFVGTSLLGSLALLLIGYWAGRARERWLMEAEAVQSIRDALKHLDDADGGSDSTEVG